MIEWVDEEGMRLTPDLTKEFVVSTVDGIKS